MSQFNALKVLISLLNIFDRLFRRLSNLFVPPIKLGKKILDSGVRRRSFVLNNLLMKRQRRFAKIMHPDWLKLGICLRQNIQSECFIERLVQMGCIKCSKVAQFSLLENSPSYCVLRRFKRAFKQNIQSENLTVNFVTSALVLNCQDRQFLRSYMLSLLSPSKLAFHECKQTCWS